MSTKEKSDRSHFVRGFQDFLTLEKGMSDHSISAYTHDVAYFFDYIDMHTEESNILTIEMDVLRAYIQYLGELGLNATTQSRMLSGIRAFYKYLLVEDIIEVNPTLLIENPKLARKIPEVLSIAEVQAILEAVDLSHPQGTRNRAILETLYACGLRVSELTDLRITNLFLEIGIIKVIGKNDKERLVPIGDQAIKHIRYWLEHDRPRIKDIKKGEENHVFLNRRGSRLSRVMIFNIVKDHVMKAGIYKTVSPHTFRHSFATHLVEGGADLKAVQDMLGHESIMTTEIYTHIDTEYLRDTVMTYHPLYQSADRKN